MCVECLLVFHGTFLARDVVTGQCSLCCLALHIHYALPLSPQTWEGRNVACEI